VTAFVCDLLACILIIIAISCTSWLETNGVRQGLWEKCDMLQSGTICTELGADLKDWTIACASLCILSLLVLLVAAVLCGVGLSTKDVQWKFKYYRVAMYLMFAAAALLVTSLIVYPVMFIQDTERRINRKWYFGWGYGVAWGATIFSLGAAIILLCDKETEEIFYREKTYHHKDEESR